MEYFLILIVSSPRVIKFNFVSPLIFRCYSICCSMELFHIEIIQLKEIFEKNGYDNKFFGRCLQIFLNKIYSNKVQQHTFSKKDLYFLLPYLGKLSLSARTTLEKTICNILACIEVVFRIKSRLSSIHSKIKYQKKCIPYFVTSFSKVAAMLLIMVKPSITLRSVSLNICESLHVQVKTSSLPKIVVRDHVLVCNNIVSFVDFYVLANGTNDLLIHLDGPLLNKNL